MGSELHIPLSIKLSLVTAAIILAAVVPIAFRNSQLFESSFGRSQYDANAELANSKSTEVDGLILKYLEKTRTLADLLEIAGRDAGQSGGQNAGQSKTALDIFFRRDLDLVNVEIYHLKDGRPILSARKTNDTFLRDYGLDAQYLNRLRQERPLPFSKLFSEKNRVHIENATLAKGAPLLTIAFGPDTQTGVITQVIVADIRLDRLQAAFSLSGARTMYLVDSRGSVLAHSRNDRLALEGKAIAHVPIVQTALENKIADNGQKRFRDPDLDEWYVGAYSKTAFGLTVVVQAPEATILEPARLVRYDVFEIAGYVLSGAIFVVIIFSLTLTHPIEKLHEAMIYVANGNFNISARVRTRDEVGELAKGFNRMVEGLKERDKVKNLFNKFHGSTITEDLLKRDLHLGGSRKEVTVFFSDIRDFTKFSEGHTPEEVVEMLNEYFQIMVGIITQNHGVVDKFVGDAIMAVWGAPSSSGDDRAVALKASLEMRVALEKLNESRLGRGQTAIKIGMGLHSGPAISGTIGSTERMEYTVIGDTVNMASRIEAATKAYGTDLLVSETVADALKDKFILEYAGSSEVKGKSEPLKLFKVRGYVDTTTGKQILLKTAYSDYEAGHVDKVKVAG